MARRRYISTKISLDAKVNKLAMTAGDFAALLYTWMIPHAEDDARLAGDPDELLMTICPGRRDKTAEDITQALQAMHDLDLIVWDRAANVVQFPTSFYQFQSYIKARMPAQPVDTPSPASDNSANQRKSAQNASSFSFSSSLKSSSSLSSFAPHAATAASSRKNKPPVTEATTTPNPFFAAYTAALNCAVPRNKAPAWANAFTDMAEQGITPEDIPKLLATYALKFPGMAPSPMALQGNLPYLKAAITTQTQPTPQERRHAEYAEHRRLAQEMLG